MSTMCALAALVRDVRLLVRERFEEVLAAPHEQDAAGLRQAEPLVGVERDRVGAVEPREEVAGRRGRRRRQPVRAVDVEPDALASQTSASASIGSTAPVRVVPAVATTATGTRPAARSARIASATASGGIRRSPSIGSERTLLGAEPEDLGRALDRVVGLVRAVERRGGAAEAPTPRARASRARARPRAPVMLETVPPLVKAPARGRKAERTPPPSAPPGARARSPPPPRRRGWRRSTRRAGRRARRSRARTSRRRRSSAAASGAMDSSSPRRASSSTSSALDGHLGSALSSSSRRRSSIGGSVSRARSKLVHARMTMSAARSSASSRGMSRLRVTRGE